MKYYVDKDASSFEFWSIAKENIETAGFLGTQEQVFEILEEIFSYGNTSATEINDYVSFVMPEEYPELFGVDEDDV